MARPTIPQYPIDGEAVYIPEADDAWDHERIDRERASMAEAKVTHPVDDYWTGETRARIDVVSEYVDMSKNPEQWVIEDIHFPPGPRREVAGLVSRAVRLWEEGDKERGDEMFSRAFLVAFKWGIRAVRNPPVEIKRARDGSIADSTIAELDKLIPGLVTEIGAVVYRAIQPLTSAEGK